MSLPEASLLDSPLCRADRVAALEDSAPCTASCAHALRCPWANGKL